MFETENRSDKIYENSLADLHEILFLYYITYLIPYETVRNNRLKNLKLHFSVGTF